MVACAHALMDGEKIKDEFYQDILAKCQKGVYACEDDIKKDVAYAIYSSREAKEKRFSTAIPSIEIGSEKKQSRECGVTAAEGLQKYLNKK